MLVAPGTNPEILGGLTSNLIAIDPLVQVPQLASLFFPSSAMPGFLTAKRVGNFVQ